MMFVTVLLKAARIITTNAAKNYLTNKSCIFELYKFGIHSTTTRG